MTTVRPPAAHWVRIRGGPGYSPGPRQTGPQLKIELGGRKLRNRLVVEPVTISWRQRLHRVTFERERIEVVPYSPGEEAAVGAPILMSVVRLLRGRDRPRRNMRRQAWLVEPSYLTGVTVECTWFRNAVIVEGPEVRHRFALYDRSRTDDCRAVLPELYPDLYNECGFDSPWIIRVLKS